MCWMSFVLEGGRGKHSYSVLNLDVGLKTQRSATSGRSRDRCGLRNSSRRLLRSFFRLRTMSPPLMPSPLMPSSLPPPHSHPTPNPHNRPAKHVRQTTLGVLFAWNHISVVIAACNLTLLILSYVLKCASLSGFVVLCAFCSQGGLLPRWLY